MPSRGTSAFGEPCWPTDQVVSSTHKKGSVRPAAVVVFVWAKGDGPDQATFGIASDDDSIGSSGGQGVRGQAKSALRVPGPLRTRRVAAEPTQCGSVVLGVLAKMDVARKVFRPLDRQRISEEGEELA